MGPCRRAELSGWKCLDHMMPLIQRSRSSTEVKRASLVGRSTLMTDWLQVLNR